MAKLRLQVQRASPRQGGDTTMVQILGQVLKDEGIAGFVAVHAMLVTFQRIIIISSPINCIVPGTLRILGRAAEMSRLIYLVLF